MRKTHLANMRLRVNAGMDFPDCHADAKLLDCDKSRLRTTVYYENVTCRRCLARQAKRDRAVNAAMERIAKEGVE